MGELNKKIFELTLAVYRVTDIFPKDEVLKRQIREKANEILSSVCEYDRKIGENNARFLLAKIQAIRTYLGVARFTNLAKAVNTAVLDREYDFFVNFFERELVKLSEEIQEKGPHSTAKRSDLDQIPQIQAVSVSSTPKQVRKPKVERSIIYSQKVSLENGNGNGNGNSNGHINHIANNGIISDVKSESNGFNERQQTILDYIRSNQQVKSTDLAGIFSNKFSIKTLQRDLSSLIGNNVIEREGDKRWAVYRLKG